MKFTDLFVRRPVLALVISTLILMLGVIAILQLPIRQYPEVSDTKIEIRTIYPGANADQIKGFITTPLQQAVAGEAVEAWKSREILRIYDDTFRQKRRWKSDPRD